MTAAAVAALETLALPAGTIVLIDIRHPVQHTAVMLALALLGLPSASLGMPVSLARLGIRPGLLLTDREDVAVEGVTRHIVDARWFAFDAAVPPPYARLLALPGFTSPDAVVRYVFSSGTTGIPKCVALTAAVLERRVLDAALLHARYSGAGLNMLGFSTVAGVMVPLIALPNGILLCFSSSNEEALRMIRLFNVSMLSLAVVQLAGFLRVLGSDPPPASLRMLAVSGARLPSRLLLEARARLCSNITTGYGSTEMGSVTTGNSISLDREDGSVGYLLPGVELEAVDAEGRKVAPGSDGILRARSPEMAFYADSGADTVELFRDGWFYPGDVGRVFEDGLVVVTGRTNEIINRGGVIVAPELIEEVLRLDPLVEDVAVVGVMIDGIEQIWAAIVSAAPFEANDIARRAHPHLNEKVPDRILRVEAIPRNPNGKVTRNVLRDELLARVGRAG